MVEITNESTCLGAFLCGKSLINLISLLCKGLFRFPLSWVHSNICVFLRIFFYLGCLIIVFISVRSVTMPFFHFSFKFCEFESSLFFVLVSSPRCLSILLIFSKNQLWFCCFFSLLFFSFLFYLFSVQSLLSPSFSLHWV